MRTPAGKECRYYYEDFHRGRSRQECRLIAPGAGVETWRPADCGRCPVPEILWANSSEHLELAATIEPGLFLGLGRRVNVEAHCSKHEAAIDDPYVGCIACASERPSLANFFPPGDDS